MDQEELIAQQLAGRRIPQRAVRMSREMMQQRMQGARSDPIEHELSLPNIMELSQELARTRDPRARAILQAEYERLRDAAANLQPLGQGPLPPVHAANPVINFLGGRPERVLTDTPGGMPPWQRINVDPVPNARPAMPFPPAGGVRG